MLWVYDHYEYFSFFSAEIVFIRQNLSSTDRFYTSESDVYSRQTYKDGPCAITVNELSIMFRSFSVDNSIIVYVSVSTIN